MSHGQMASRRSWLDVHEFNGDFRGGPARFRVTSVIGHVLSIDFPPSYQSWDATDPASLFTAPTVKTESNPKAHVCKHLQTEAKGCDALVLWLDCDREGENICFEVMAHTQPSMRSPQNVFRAKFSAIGEKDIRQAMARLGAPNEAEAKAVDARQEIDLKVGVAFTRFQTRFFQGKYGNLDSSLISYGPCQTPTLGFCVARHQRITSFVSEPFWAVRPIVVRDGRQLALQWARGRLFDKEVAEFFQRDVAAGGAAVVKSVAMKEERKGRPTGLNTVEMLKAASSGLGMGPHHAMQIAERLYTQGYISYPRTESTAYPSSFDYKEALSIQSRHPIWGEYVQSLLQLGPSPPRAGKDEGDHPPITPMRAADEGELGGGDAWRLYDLVTRHFIGSFSPDCRIARTRVTFSVAGEHFSASGRKLLSAGFTAVMPWLAVGDEGLPAFVQGESVALSAVELYEGRTSPPDYLTESELIGLMERHGIGTDASIPVHINNICERNYAQVAPGRKIVPTTLGTTLVRGYQQIDPDLCLPDIRRFIEQQITLIAQGKADHGRVVTLVLQQFFEKFKYFVSQIARMDSLFEAHFSPLAASGKPMGRCGKCGRFMRFVSLKPTRLFCPTCEDIFNLPQNGAIKLYKELTCPLDNYELVLYSLPGPEGKTFPLCPYCYNHPPFEDLGKPITPAASTTASSSKPAAVSSTGPTSQASSRTGSSVFSGMVCTSCRHVSCRHSLVSMGVCPCPECEGTLVLDPDGSGTHVPIRFFRHFAKSAAAAAGEAGAGG
ncbi:unnamed protein product [Closterium sp. NIES-64]|nr:unnamed protein product [Closterium sp. NIES-64]